MSKNPRLPEGDDGKTIVNMNVEGMPWYVPESPDAAERRERERLTGHVEQYTMTKEESRIYMWGAIKASLLIVLVFGVSFFLFILFCEYVWFK